MPRVRPALTATVTLATASVLMGSTARADFIDWLGLSPTGNWTVGAQWEDGSPPAPDDIAIFPNHGGGWICTVDTSPAVLGILMQDPGATIFVPINRTLTVLDDPADVNGILAIPAGTIELQNGHLVVDDSINGGGSIDNDGLILTHRSSSITTPSLLNAGGEVRVESRPGINSDLTIARPFTNDGTLTLGSVGNGWAMITPSSAAITNAAGGTVRFEGGGSNPLRYFRTDLDSHGLVRVEGSSTAVFDQANTSLRLLGGSLEIDPGGSLVNNSASLTLELDGGDFINLGSAILNGGAAHTRLAAGSIGGSGILFRDTSIEFPSGSTADGPITLERTNSISGDIPRGMSVVARSVPGINTTMNFAGDLIDGDLDLTSASGNGFVLVNFAAPTTINGDLTTVVANGSNPLRYLRGDVDLTGDWLIGAGTDARFDESGRTLTNTGSIEIEPGGVLRGPASTHLRHEAGLMQVDGLVDWTSGSIVWAGGEITGTPWQLSDSSLQIDPAAAGPAEFHFDRSANFFTGDIVAGRAVRIWSRPGINSQVRFESDVDISGLLSLESEGNGFALIFPSTDDRHATVMDGGVLRLATGGSNPQRYVRIDTTVRPGGLLDVQDGTQGIFDGAKDLIIEGTMTVSAAGDVRNNGTASTLRLDGGTIDNLGVFTWNSAGRIELASGSITGNPIFTFDNVIAFDEGSDVSANIISNRAGSIEGDIPATVDFEIRSTPGINSSRTVEKGATLAGTLRLTAVEGGNGWAMLAGPFGTGTPVVNTGSITMQPIGTNPNRYFTLDLHNEGSIEVETGVTGRIQNGFLTNPGTLRVDGLLFREGLGVDVDNQPGGTLSGTGTVGSNNSLVVNRGTVSPGNGGQGVLATGGDFEQSESGTLRVELGGEVPGSGHDQLAVDGVAILGGVLDLRVLAGFTPTPGMQFTILSAEEIVGTFDAITCSANWSVSYTDSSVIVGVLGAPVFGDVDCDGVVGFSDLLAVLAAWGSCPDCPADLDGNGEVDFDDLLTLLVLFD